MGENIQNNQCSRCHSKTQTVIDFGLDKNGNCFKTCNNCRESSNQRKSRNREAIQLYYRHYYQQHKETELERKKQWRNDNVERLTEIIKCDCGGKYQYRTKAEHERTKRHQQYITSLN